MDKAKNLSLCKKRLGLSRSVFHELCWDSENHRNKFVHFFENITGLLQRTGENLLAPVVHSRLFQMLFQNVCRKAFLSFKKEISDVTSPEKSKIAFFCYYLEASEKPKADIDVNFKYLGHGKQQTLMTFNWLDHSSTSPRKKRILQDGVINKISGGGKKKKQGRIRVVLSDSWSVTEFQTFRLPLDVYVDEWDHDLQDFVPSNHPVEIDVQGNQV